MERKIDFSTGRRICLGLSLNSRFPLFFYDAKQFFRYFRNLSGMDSFSPGGRFSQSHESLTNGTVDDIIRESSDDIDHRSIIDQWPPVGQRKQGWFFVLFC